MKAARIKNLVSSDLTDHDQFRELFSDQLERARTREYLLGVIKEYVGSVEFMDKSCEYAGREIDKRLLNSTKFWVGFLVTTVATAIITTLITFAFRTN